MLRFSDADMELRADEFVARLQAIYDKLEDGGEFTDDDYEFITEIYRGEIPYGTLTGDTGFVDEWFIDTWSERIDHDYDPRV